MENCFSVCFKKIKRISNTKIKTLTMLNIEEQLELLYIAGGSISIIMEYRLGITYWSWFYNVKL